jgi:hypothetical protein
MSPSDQTAATLTATLSAAFAAHEVSAGRIVIQTPFQFGDGDGYAVVIEANASGWRLTDMGGTASHLAVEDIDFTPARLEMLVDIAEDSGFSFDDLVLSRVQPRIPDQFDVADLLQAIAMLTAIRFLSREQIRRLYRDDVAKFVEARVPQANRVFRWSPPTDAKGVYASDALLWPAAKMTLPTTLFAVGNAEQAERATISILMHKRWELEVQPLVVFDRRVVNRIGSPRIYHLQDAAGDDSVVPAIPGQWTTVERELEARHIPLSAA